MFRVLTCRRVFTRMSSAHSSGPVCWPTLRAAPPLRTRMTRDRFAGVCCTRMSTVNFIVAVRFSHTGDRMQKAEQKKHVRFLCGLSALHRPPNSTQKVALDVNQKIRHLFVPMALLMCKAISSHVSSNEMCRFQPHYGEKCMG